MKHHGHHDCCEMVSDPQEAKMMERSMRFNFLIAFFLTIPIFLYSPMAAKMFKIALPAPLPFLSDGGVGILVLLLSTVVVFRPGFIFIGGAYRSLKKLKLDMSVLIAVGVLAAYLFSLTAVILNQGETFFDAAAMLVTFVLFGHWMEMRSRRGTTDAIKLLFDLVPPMAKVLRMGREMSVPSSEIKHGDVVVIKPGDKIPVDGKITEGETTINESFITGESLPVVKKMGDKVIGGSINLSGAFKFEAMQIGKETVLAHIIKMVEDAQNSKAPGQRLADKAAAWLVVTAIGSGLAAFFGWYFWSGAPFFTALTFAISAVVIACPDALGLATPTAVAVGTGLGAKHNILIKDAATLENISKINTIILDKTGTLTEGRPAVSDIVSFNGFSADDVLKYAAIAEANSNHPLAKSITEEAEKKNLFSSEIMEKFESFSGLGVRAVIKGKIILAGKEVFLKNNGIDVSASRNVAEKMSKDGKSTVMLAVDGKFAGIISAADIIKSTAKEAVLKLKSMGIDMVMMTGDSRLAAEAVAKEVGIEKVFAEVLPQDKAGYVKNLQGENKFVAMVGDGINDAPALAQADIGIAIGAGADVAKETGGVILAKSDPMDIVAAIRLSKATVRKMKENLFWAAGYNVLAIPVAAGVFYSSFGLSLRPEISALLMSISSIVVAINAVLLKKVESKLRA